MSVENNTRYTNETGKYERLPQFGPLLIVSNHPFSLRMLPAMLDISRTRRRDLTIIANKVFSPYLEKLQIHTIRVDSIPHQSKGNMLQDLWGQALSFSQRIVPARVQSEDISVTDSAAALLKDGGAVWITPTGSRERSQGVRWHAGVGAILKSVEDLT